MFKHILIPTDGSAVADKAVRAGLAMAARLGAKVTGYSSVQPIQTQFYGDGYVFEASMVKRFEREAVAAAERRLEKVSARAKAAGVPFSMLVTTSVTAYEGIVEAARKRKCDAIFMASHGRTGIAGMVLGSVTHKVLTHTKLPVLVYR